jgi:hypothetical protein
MGIASSVRSFITIRYESLLMGDIRHRMSDLHERWFTRLFAGSLHPGSGNQLANQADGHRSAYRYGLGWVWDCKSTVAKSISVTLAAWDKLTEQAGTDRPLMPLRLYLNHRLTQCVDLVVMKPEDLIEILEMLEESERRLDGVRDRMINCLPRYKDHPMVIAALAAADGEL